MRHGQERGVSYLPLTSIAAQVRVFTYIMYMPLPQWSHEHSIPYSCQAFFACNRKKQRARFTICTVLKDLCLVGMPHLTFNLYGGVPDHATLSTA